MFKFKVGDRVRVKDNYPFKFENLIGKVGTVLKVEGSLWPVEVKIDNDGLAVFNENELELEN